MKRTVLLLVLLPLCAFAKVHYAKVEPLERTTIKSSVSGTIVKVDLSAEGRFVGDGVVIQIDDAMDRISLRTSKETLALTQRSLKLNEMMLEAQRKTYAENQLLGTKEKIINFKKQILDLEYKIALLEDSIAKKSITMKGRYLYKLMVRAGEFANPGLPLVIADDLSKAKLTLYLDRDELEGIENKRVYIQGDEEGEGLPIVKVWKEADEKFISSYRAEVILEPTHRFSSLLKVEVR